jgi:hypothetical protein
MQKIILSSLVFIILNCNVLLSQSITVVAPSNGGILKAGSTYLIKWQDFGVNYVTGWYSTNGGQNWTQIDGFYSILNTHSFSWKVPNYKITNCKVKVANSDNNSIYGLSGSFSIDIAKSNISVISPNGGEKFYAGEQKIISWTANSVNYVNGFYSTNSGATWISITGFSQYPNTSSFVWKIPAISSNKCEIKIVDANDNSNFDLSDSDFSIELSNGISEYEFLNSYLTVKIIVNDKYTIKNIDCNNNANFELLNLNGNVIDKKYYTVIISNNSISFDCSSLATGIYFVNLNSKIILIYKK